MGTGHPSTRAVNSAVNLGSGNRALDPSNVRVTLPLTLVLAAAYRPVLDLSARQHAGLLPVELDDDGAEDRCCPALVHSGDSVLMADELSRLRPRDEYLSFSTA